jgi:hypothetical protein
MATFISSSLSNNAAKSPTLSYPYSTQGGGIFNHGTLVLSGCTVSGNISWHEAGGIFNDGTLTISGGTVSGSLADYGGGIVNHGTLGLSGCTVSGNLSIYEAGGIFNDGTLTVENSSFITGNTGPGGYIAVDVDNLGVLYLDGTSTIGILVGNPANLI